MNEPKQTQLNIEKTGWSQLTLLDDAPTTEPRPILIRSALRCPLCGAQLDHIIGERCECPRCGMELDL